MNKYGGKMNRRKPYAVYYALMAFCVLCSCVYAVEVCVDENHVRPGKAVAVPVYIRDAGEVTSLEFQLNYDPEFLVYEGYTTTPLSTQFVTEVTTRDGSLYVAAARSAPLSAADGLFILLNMRALEGSVPGETMSNLALAKARIHSAESVPTVSTNQNGELWVVFSDLTDSDGDGISDYEEQISDGTARYNPYSATNPDGTGADIHNPDTDGDKVPDTIEIARGYGFADPAEWLAFGGEPDHPYLITTDQGNMINWYGVDGATFKISYSTNLMNAWKTLPGAEALAGTAGNNSFIDPVTNGAFRAYRVEAW